MKALITGLVLSLSSVAFATPAPTYHRPAHQLQRRPPIAHWKTLARHQHVTGLETIYVRSNAAFTKLKLEAAAGTTFVDKVRITFGNGRTQLVDLDKRLHASAPLLIDLNGSVRKVTKVEVFGRSTLRSSINVLGV